MRRGFTLIELLAVIVILAIIALIATPIVLSIIDDTKKSSMLRSAEMYLNGVENSIMKENMNEGGNYRPNDCTITNGLVKCDDYEGIAVEVDGEVPQDGSTIKFENGKIVEVRLVYKSATIVMDEKNNLVFAEDKEDTSGTNEKTLATICTLVSGTEKTAGAKYSCEVKEGTSYNFYVLTTPEEGSETINLIMDRNICEDGTPTESGKTCLVAWLSKDDYINNDGPNTEQFTDEGACQYGGLCSMNELGPITAMTYLNKATSTWENIDNLNLTYDDEGNHFTDFELNGKARLPYKSEVSAYDSTNKTNAYLYDYLDSGEGIPTNAIGGIYGYWTLSSNAVDSFYAWYVRYDGSVEGTNVFADDYLGVRAVINLKI